MSQASSNGIAPNRQFQRTNIASFTESRRQRFLALRKQNRELYFEKARKIVLNNAKASKEDIPKNANQKNKHVSMFMIHEWLIDIPTDLLQNWLVGLRAEGERCLVFSEGGKTVSRNRSGKFIHNRFPSLLPCGNYAQQKKSNLTVLDCIWIKPIRTYYVIDCLTWNDQNIGSSDASMRLWFVQSKLKECANIDTFSKYNKFRFVCIDTMNVTLDNLNSLYLGTEHEAMQHSKEEQKNEKTKECKIRSDGLLFYHKHGSYVSNVSCPLILIWKDDKISRWFVDTSNRQNENKSLQFVTLQLQSNGGITTHEKDIVFSVMPSEQIKKYNLRPNQLLRFTITNAVMNECKVDNLLYVKRASVSKMHADTWSKIVFQHQAKNGITIQFQDILNFVAHKNGQNESDCDNNMDNIDEQLRVATLGLSDIHL